MNIRHVYVATVLTALGATTALAQDSGWQRYVVPQSGAAVDIPIGVFSQDAGAAEPGYGRRRTTADGRANLTVQSFPNESSETPATFLAKQRPPRDIIYRKVTQRFFAVSSIRDGKIWYNRCNAAGRFMNCVLINYPAGEKRQWDGIVTRISNTLASSG